MLKKEVNYRLAKWLLAGMEHDGIISKAEMLAAREKLVEYYQPPFAEVEGNVESIGDGVTVGNRTDN